MEIDSSGLNIGEVASVWTPSITITIFGIDISVGAEIGAVGGSLNVGNGSLSVQGTLGIGASIKNFIAIAKAASRLYFIGTFGVE